jgi:hypothetical protein
MRGDPLSIPATENEFRLLTFDPGAAASGWARFIVDIRAFSRPEHKLLRWIKSWDCGEFTGPEQSQLSDMVTAVQRNLDDQIPYLMYQVVSEDFDLTQMIGGKNLLSPVRMNAVLGWECHKRAVKFHLQNRSLRTSVTPSRLTQFGFDRYRWKTSGAGKDMFAAMQHGITWLRNTKKSSRSHPWKLSERSTLNAYYDCDCADGKPCDLAHPV